MGQNDVDVKVKLTAMSSGLKEMANQLKELGGLKKESDMFAKAATNIAASIAVVNNIAGQGEVNTFKQYVASVEASFNKLSSIGAKLSKFRKILNEDMASIDLNAKNIDKNIVTIDEYKSMNSGQNVAIARQKVMSEQREIYPRLNKIDDTRLASYKSISKLTDAQVEKDYAAYVETRKATIQTDLVRLEELRETAFELYKLEKEVLKQELVEEKNKLRILKETHEKRLKGKVSQAEDWESPEEEDEARHVAESEKNKLRQDREIEAAKDVEIELREKANAQMQRDIELKQKVEKELRQDEALARKQFKEQVNLAKYNEKVGVMPSGLSASNVALSSSQSQLDVAGVEKELNTRVQILKQLQAETKEKERQVGLAKNTEELEERIVELRNALEREEYGKASVKEAQEILKLTKEQTQEFKTQESIKARRKAIGSPDMPISNEKLIDAASQGNVEVVKQDLENRKQILEIAKLNVLEAQKELSLAQTKEEISKASINEQQARANQAHIEKDVALAKEQLKIAEKTAQVKKKEQEDIQKTDEIMKQAHKRIADLGGASKKIDFHKAQLEVARLNADLKEIPQHLRKAKAEELAKTLKAAGINAHQVGSELRLAAAGSKKLEGQLKTSIKEFFSMEKLIQRITFVITATLSYKAFQVFTDSIKNAIKLNIDFQDEMGKTFALIANESDKVKADLAETVRSLSLKYRIDLKEATEGIYQIISAQIGVENAAKVLEASMQLAKGGFSDLNSSALALVQTLNAFELGAEKASHVADVMFETTRLGIATTEQLSSQMSKIASTASIFGLSIEEVSAAISTMTRNGVKVDQAFTSLNQLLMTIANPTEEAKKTMEAYGVTLDMNAVRANGLTNAIASLGEILQSEEAMTDIVKSRTGFKALATLAQNIDDYVDDLIAMYDSVGAAQEAANERLNTTKSTIEKLKFTLSDFGLSIGQNLDSTVRKIANSLDNLIKGLIKILPFIITSLKIIVTQLVIMKLPLFFTMIVNGIKGVVTSLKSFRFVMLQVASIARGTSVAIKGAFATATAGLSVIIGLVAQLIGFLVTLAKKAKDAEFSQTMGIAEAEIKLKELSGELETLNSKVSAIDGILKLIKQTDILYEKTKNNVDLLESWKKQHESVSKAIFKILDEETGKTIEAGKLGDWHNRLIAARIKNIQTAILTELQFQQITLTNNLSKQLLDAGINKKSPKLYSPIRWLANLTDKQQLGFMTEAEEQYAQMTSALYDTNLKLNQIKLQSALGDAPSRDKQIKLLEQMRDDLKTTLAGQYYTGNEQIAKVSNIAADAILEIDKLINNAEASEINLRLAEVEGLEDYLRSQDKKGGADGSKKSSKEKRKPEDKLNEFIDKYTDLFRSAGFEVENRFIDRLNDIRANIGKIASENENYFISNSKILEELYGFGFSVEKFYTASELLKAKPKNVQQAIKNKEDIDYALKEVELTRQHINDFAASISKSGIPELVALGEALPAIFEDNVAQLIDNSRYKLEDDLNALVSQARTPEEAIQISKTIAEEVYPEYITDLADAHLEELERALNDEKTPKSLQLYIKSLIDAKKKRVALGLKSMVSNYTNLLDNIEEHMNGFKELFDELQLRLGRYGVDTASLSSLIIALSTGDTKKAESILTQMQEKGNKEAEELLKKMTAAQQDVEKNKNIVDTLESSIKKKEEEKEELEAQKETIKPSEPEIVQGIDYAAILDQKQAVKSLKNTGAGAKRRNETFEQYLARALKDTPWEGWEKIRDAKTLDEKITEFYKVKNLVGKANVGNVPTKEVVVEAAKLSDTDQAKMDEINARIMDIEAEISAYQVDLPRAKESLQTAIDATPKPKMSLDEMVELLTESLPHLLPPNFKDWTPESQRSWLYEQGALKPGQRQIGEIGNLQKGELGDYLKEKVGATPMTIDEAWAIGEGKILELSTQLWSRYWEQKITAAEDARDKLIEIEENREKMMLANQNLSSEQQAKLKEKFEERRRKIQEESEKKIAEIRKKQALAELTMNFAKAIAEIWIKQLATKGTVGILESAALTALLTGIYLKQRSIVEEQEFAHGGYTGRSNAPRDRTGERPAGIVHEGELVIDRKTMDKNFHQLISLYDALKSGKSFAQAVSQQRTQNPAILMNMRRLGSVPAYAGGGYVGKQLQFNEPINVMVNFQGMRVLDDIDINIMAEQGGRKRRVIRG